MFLQRLCRNKILVLGSGGLSIGQAGEFDYSGSQAIKALQQDGHQTILINANIASIQSQLCDQVYYLPVNKKYVTQVIEKEKPQSVLLSVGGQTAMNIGLELESVFQSNGVEVLGTPLSSVKIAEDRDLFANALMDINIPIAPSIAAYTVEEALKAADQITYPVIIRSAFSLGGLGSGFAHNKEELQALATKSLTLSNQILIEKSMVGWKEIEYEVMRDKDDNTICICNMENFDPLGVHTGDSCVVAPSQTLNDKEHQMLRQASIDIVRKVGVIGECNVQFALNPNKYEFKVIEMNPRLSRSSALASKATGYPLAYLSTKLALGHVLTDLKNVVTKTTTAGFEPSLDYVVVKFPKWDLAKFPNVSRKIGSQMKAIGEVMAIGKTFEESFQKGLRCLGLQGFEPHRISKDVHEELKTSGTDKKYWSKILSEPTDERIFAIANAFHHGLSAELIHEFSKIDLFFLYKLENIYNMQLALANGLDSETLKECKKLGFSDAQIAKYTADSEKSIREKRKSLNILPFVKRIDTLAGEFPSDNNYLYMTYHGDEHDLHFDQKGIIVLGSGVYRIGSSCEFDWCTTSALRSIRNLGKSTISINNNPETVSTDYDESDRLYFEELTVERILDIYELEKSQGIIVSVGGQTSQNVSVELNAYGCKIFGTSTENINKAESRNLFGEILDELEIKQPEWHSIVSEKEATQFAKDLYPVLVRPSWVLSGSAFQICHNEEELQSFMKLIKIDKDFPVVLSQFIENAQEIDFDGVAKSGKVICYEISEHLEPAGIHSGDASLVLPNKFSHDPNILNIAAKIAKYLEITGPFNMQIIHRNGEYYVVECNIRASRSFPLVSKVKGFNFIDVAIQSMMNTKPIFQANSKEFTCVKVPQFSWNRLSGADVLLGVEMRSTGEVAGFANSLEGAFKIAMEGTNYFKFPQKGVLIEQQDQKYEEKLIEACKNINNLPIFVLANNNFEKLLKQNNIKYTTIKLDSYKELSKIIDLCLFFGGNKIGDEFYQLRRGLTDLGVPVITDANICVHTSKLLSTKDASLKSWQEWTGHSKM
eukprot:NODE_223_length_12360_cov_0.266862.p1 type:complete len:1052 gc:universal NODE_223_length_12360_cov_0.266862:1303-4458(+)